MNVTGSCYWDNIKLDLSCPEGVWVILLRECQRSFCHKHSAA